MLVRIASCVLGCALLAGPAVAQAPSRDDATKAEVEKLRAQAQALLAQAQALEAQARQTKAEHEAAEKYMREVAESCLEAILKGDYLAIRPLLSKEMKDDAQPPAGDPHNVDVVRRRGMAVSDYRITSTIIAPSLEEGIFRAEVSGKSTVPDDHGKEKAATIALRVHKENGRYVLGFMSAVIVK